MLNRLINAFGVFLFNDSFLLVEVKSSPSNDNLTN